MLPEVEKNIVIIGAGISGLVAGINLAKRGFQVDIHEKEEKIGGREDWHPSIHQQIFNMDATANYIGIDLNPCFWRVKSHIFYLYDRRVKIDNPPNSFLCEKGPRPSSIENYLYMQAKREGVIFHFKSEIERGKGNDRGNKQNCIIATGLDQTAYKSLGLRHCHIHGYKGSTSRDGDPSAFSFFGEYSSKEFAYVAQAGGYSFGLLFSRGDREHLDVNRFQDHLQNREGISFKQWNYSIGCIPLEKNLEKNGIVLAGTLSGMIDPFFLNGISGALVSGKIAALYFLDKRKAYYDFNAYTKWFAVKGALKRIGDWLPWKKVTLPLVIALNNKFRVVGTI